MKRRQRFLVVIVTLSASLHDGRGRSQAFIPSFKRQSKHHQHRRTLPSCSPRRNLKLPRVQARKTKEDQDKKESPKNRIFRTFFNSEKEPEPPEPEPDQGFFSRWSSTKPTKQAGVDSSKPRKKKTRSKRKNRKEQPEEPDKKKDTFSWLGKLSFSNSTKPTETPTSTASSSSSNNNPFSSVQNLWKDNTDNTGSKKNSKKSDFFSKISKSQEEWVSVFPKTRIMPGESVPVTVHGLDLLVVASLDGKSLYCIENSCPHLGTPLETGELKRLPIEIDNDPNSYNPNEPKSGSNRMILSETDVSNLLSQDGCEDCIVCPLHQTAFALRSGQVRGEWCPYPPVLGAMMGTVKQKNAAAVFDVRTRGKDVQVRFNSPLVS